MKSNEHNLFLRGLLTVKTKSRFGERYSCFGCETKTGVVRILVVFHVRLMFSHII